MIFEDWQYQITMWFENNHTPFWDDFFNAVTEVGDVTVIVLLLTLIMWNIDKHRALRIAFALVLSFIINTVLKNLFAIKRPFYRKEFTKGIPDPVDGYAFPSGHSQNAGTTWVSMMLEFDKWWIIIFSVLFMVLIPMSRVYLRVHWILDVIAGVIIGGLVAVVYYKYLSEKVFKFFTHPLSLSLATPVTFVASTLLMNENVAKGSGVAAGFLFGYWVDEKWINYEPKGQALNVMIMRQVLGLIIVIGLLEGLKIIFPDHYLYDYSRYYLVGFFVTSGCPFIFNRIWKKQLDYN